MDEQELIKRLREQLNLPEHIYTDKDVLSFADNTHDGACIRLGLALELHKSCRKWWKKR